MLQWKCETPKSLQKYVTFWQNMLSSLNEITLEDNKTTTISNSFAFEPKLVQMQNIVKKSTKKNRIR